MGDLAPQTVKPSWDIDLGRIHSTVRLIYISQREIFGDSTRHLAKQPRHQNTWLRSPYILIEKVCCSSQNGLICIYPLLSAVTPFEAKHDEQ
jgi:hypothetical protein